MYFPAYVALKIAHILSMAVWFGGGVGVATDLKRSLPLGSEHWSTAKERTNGNARRTIAAGMSTLLTGIGLILAAGGFAHVSPRIHAGLALTLATFVVGASVVQPAWTKLTKEPLPPDADRLVARMAWGFRVELLLKLVVLVLMVVPTW
jgi:hypothetical protein